MSSRRRRAQSGTTLVELLVSLVIIGLALMLVIGTLSDGLLQSTIGKRNVGVQAAKQYEMDKITSATFDPNATSYSDCFATDNQAAPTSAGGFHAACPNGYALRADVSWTQYSATVQQWTITIVTQPVAAPVGSPLSLLKVPHQ